jgi:hypothetical protein
MLFVAKRDRKNIGYLFSDRLILKIKAVRSFKTSVIVCQATLPNTPENSNLQQLRYNLLNLALQYGTL